MSKRFELMRTVACYSGTFDHVEGEYDTLDEALRAKDEATDERDDAYADSGDYFYVRDFQQDNSLSS